MYLKLTDDDFSVKEHIPDKPGIYKLIAIDDKGAPRIINRFLGVDNDGILYIGKTENIRKRLTNMRRAFLPKYTSTKHIAVRRYQEITGIKDSHPITNLVVCIEVVSDKMKSAKGLESELFKNYEAVFGERPPLNKQ